MLISTGRSGAGRVCLIGKIWMHRVRHVAAGEVRSLIELDQKCDQIDLGRV
jgi:hypothetical protein